MNTCANCAVWIPPDRGFCDRCLKSYQWKCLTSDEKLDEIKNTLDNLQELVEKLVSKTGDK